MVLKFTFLGPYKLMQLFMKLGSMCMADGGGGGLKK